VFMVKENISLIQLLTLVFNYLLGSAIVAGIGIEAKQDAWLAILMATLIGTGLMYGYYTLNKLLPNKNLFEMMEYCLTRPIAIFFSFSYIIYFLYIACRLIRTFAELIATAILPITPIEVIAFSIIIVMAYILYLGLEVLGRVSEIFTPYLLGFFFLLVLFLVTSGETEFHNLQPVLGDGLNPIIKVLPSVITFPFGELIVFTVILSSVTQFKKSKKIVLIAVIMAGVVLSAGAVITVTVIGAETIQLMNFPLLSAARRVSIGNFIERIDSFVVFIMMLSILIKGSVYLYGAAKGLEYIFRIPYRYFVVPSSMIVSIFSTLIALNYAEHQEEAKKVVLYYMHIPMQLIIPTMLIVILFLKTKRHKSQQNGVGL
jgi:spore germination protein KB